MERVRKKEEKATTRRTRGQKSEVTWATARRTHSVDRPTESEEISNVHLKVGGQKKGKKERMASIPSFLASILSSLFESPPSSSKCPIPSRKTMEFNLSPLCLRPPPPFLSSPLLSLPPSHRSSLRNKPQDIVAGCENFGIHFKFEL